MKIIVRLVALAAACLAAAAATAQTYPAKPVRIVVGLAPGGTTDVVSRILAQRLGDAWGQTVVVDNRPGASGMIGADMVAKAPADGYTLLMATAGTHGINPGLYRKLNWDPKEFTGVSLVAMVPNILVVNNALPVKSVKELIAYLKANPGKLSYGSPGLGSTAHLSMELFKSMTGTDITHVPYKGSAGVMADVMGGQIALTMDNIPPYLPQVKAGKLRALATTGAKRSKVAPELPTIAESGFPGFDVGSWYAFLVPKGTPASIVKQVHDATVKAIAMPDVQQAMGRQGLEPETSTPAELAQRIRRETEQWAVVIKEQGIKAE